MSSPVSRSITSTSPAATRRRKRSDIVKRLRKAHDFHRLIVELTKMVNRAGGSLEYGPGAFRSIPELQRLYPNGIKLTQRDINKLTTQYKKFLVTETSKMLTELTKRARRPRRAGGFKNPRVFNGEIINFFRNAGLPALNGANIIDQFSFSQPATEALSGMATQGIMSILMTVYVYYVGNDGNGLPSLASSNQPTSAEFQRRVRDGKKGFNRQHMGVDQYMVDALPNALGEVQARGIGKTRKPFDSHDFIYSTLQSIVAATVITNPGNWSENQRNALYHVVQDTEGKTFEVKGMPADEKAAYEAIVLPAETAAKEEYEQAKKATDKKDRDFVQKKDIPYSDLKVQVQNRVGHDLSIPTQAQIELDRQSWMASRYLIDVKAAFAEEQAQRLVQQQ